MEAESKAKAMIRGDPIRLAMLGMVDGNGHPYSWSAIFNGYDRAAMAGCPFAGIPGQTHLNCAPTTADCRIMRSES